MQLHLQQPLVYTKELSVPPLCDKAYNLLMEHLAQAPIGTDACLICEALLTADLCSVSSIAAYYNLSEEQAQPIRTIEAGSYQFYQVPFAPTEGKHLIPLLNRFAIDFDYSHTKKQPCYVRLYKERPFEITIQFIAPIHTIKG